LSGRDIGASVRQRLLNQSLFKSPNVARARIPMQVDIGFGDVIVPAPTQVEYPTLLEQ
jgi:hypothetical protein